MELDGFSGYSAAVQTARFVLLLALLGTSAAQQVGTATRSSRPSEVPALEAIVRKPHTLAYGKGFLYIAANGGLLRLNVGAGLLKIVLPKLEGEEDEFAYPNAVAVGREGQVFVATFDGRLNELNPETGRVTVLLQRDAFDVPEALAIDHEGNLLIVDHHHQLFRWRLREQRLETLSGTGYAGFDGDGGSPINAKLQFPQGVALNSTGEIFIADYQNCRIRRIDPAIREITTVAGTGECASKGDGGLASKAALNYPSSLAIDAAGDLFFVEGATDRVRRITASGIISTYAGTGVKGFSGDGGPANQAELNNPSGVAVDEAGNLFISEYVNNRVRRVAAATHAIITVAGNGNPHDDALSVY